MCRFCNTQLLTQICWQCKQERPTGAFWVRKTGSNAGYLERVCKICTGETKREWDKRFPEQMIARNKRFIKNHLAIADNKYSDWVDLTKIDFKVLSEDEWLQACMYFGGCAICGDEYIEVRQFFVPFQSGGRYTAWNMFPMCGKCAKQVRRSPNPFKWLDKSLGTAFKLGLTEERKERLVEYFLLQVGKGDQNATR